MEDKAVDLDRFDRIDIDVVPGQAWYHAGDLVFRLGNVETFRLEGVSRPAAFRETCLKSHLAHATVKQSRQRQRRWSAAPRLASRRIKRTTRR